MAIYGDTPPPYAAIDTAAPIELCRLPRHFAAITAPVTPRCHCHHHVAVIFVTSERSTRCYNAAATYYADSRCRRQPSHGFHCRRLRRYARRRLMLFARLVSMPFVSRLISHALMTLIFFSMHDTPRALDVTNTRHFEPSHHDCFVLHATFSAGFLKSATPVSMPARLFTVVLSPPHRCSRLLTPRVFITKLL